MTLRSVRVRPSQGRSHDITDATAVNFRSAPPAAAEAIYEKAEEPKGMKTLPVLYFEMYYRKSLVSKAAGEAISWYEQYL